MLTFLNVLFKPLLRSKCKLKIYFQILFFSFIFLLTLFQFRNYLFIIYDETNLNIDNRMLVINNVNDHFTIEEINKYDDVELVYQNYDFVSLSNEIISDINLVFAPKDFYSQYLIRGVVPNYENSNEIVIPNIIKIDNKEVDLSQYFNKKLSFNYYVDNKLYNYTAKVVGIYDGVKSGINYLYTSFHDIKLISTISGKSDTYYIIASSMEKAEQIKHNLQKKYNIFFYNNNSYQEGVELKNIIKIFNIVVILIIIFLLITINIMLNNFLYDIRKDIAILKSIGYTNIKLLQMIFLLFLLLIIISLTGSYIICTILTAIINYLKLYKIISCISFTTYYVPFYIVVFIFLLLMLLQFFISLIFLRKIKKISVSEILKI